MQREQQERYSWRWCPKMGPNRCDLVTGVSGRGGAHREQKVVARDGVPSWWGHREGSDLTPEDSERRTSAGTEQLSPRGGVS